MDYSSSKIARNTTYFTAALVAQKLISFVYFSYIAVKIGAGNLGSYTFALSFTTIFAVLIDIGISNVLVREVAKTPEKSQSLLSSALKVKIPLAIFIYILAVLLINFLDNPVLVKQLVYLSGVIMILDSFTLTFYSFLRGHQNLKFESIGTIIFQIIVFISGFIAVHLSKDLRWLILAVLIASLFNFIYSATLLKIKLKLNFFAKTDNSLVKNLLVFTLPFALAAIFTRVYGYLDTVLLHQMISPEAVGYYSIPYKIIFSLQFIPMAFVASLYPAFSSYFTNNKELLAKTFQKSFIYLGMIVLPLTFGIIALTKPLILKVYTAAYEPSILPLQILAISLPFLFLNFPLGSLLNACNRQGRNTIHIAIVMIINAILNVILISRFSFIGAAIASTVSTIIMYCLQGYVARQIIPIDTKYIAKKILAFFLASYIMFFCINSLINTVNFILLVPIGVVIYGIFVYLFKGITINDIKEFKRIHQKT